MVNRRFKKLANLQKDKNNSEKKIRNTEKVRELHKKIVSQKRNKLNRLNRDLKDLYKIMKNEFEKSNHKKNYTNDEWSRIQQREQKAINLEKRVEYMKKEIENDEKSIRRQTQHIQDLKKLIKLANNIINSIITEQILNTRGING